MSTHTIYCSACDREVQVMNLPGTPLEGGGREVPVAPAAACLSHGQLCTGTMCPLFEVPPAVMADRLAAVRDARQAPPIPEATS